MSKTKNETKTLLKVSFSIAIIIFFTAVMSDFSVTMFNSNNVWWVKSIVGLIAIVLITLLIWVLLTAIPELKKPFLLMFGEK